MKSAIQLTLAGHPTLPRAYLYQKQREMSLDARGYHYFDDVWHYMCAFDRPQWCRLVDKPVDFVEGVA